VCTRLEVNSLGTYMYKFFDHVKPKAPDEQYSSCIANALFYTVVYTEKTATLVKITDLTLVSK